MFSDYYKKRLPFLRQPRNYFTKCMIMLERQLRLQREQLLCPCLQR